MLPFTAIVAMPGNLYTCRGGSLYLSALSGAAAATAITWPPKERITSRRVLSRDEHLASARD